jgi:hypothetical protein
MSTHTIEWEYWARLKEDSEKLEQAKALLLPILRGLGGSTNNGGVMLTPTERASLCSLLDVAVQNVCPNCTDRCIGQCDD